MADKGINSDSPMLEQRPGLGVVNLFAGDRLERRLYQDQARVELPQRLCRLQKVLFVLHEFLLQIAAVAASR